MAVSLTSVALPPVPTVLADRVPPTVSWLARMSALAWVVVKLALPVTVMALVAVMPVLPPLVTLRLPEMFSVGSTMSAVLKFSVRLRRLVRPASEGMDVSVEPPRARSRTRVWSPATMKAPPNALPPLPSSMSEPAVSTVSTTSPPVVSVAPAACVMLPLEVAFSEPPTLEVASSTSLMLTTVASAFAPVVLTAKVPATSWLSTVIVALLVVVV